jgi:hypothetical protein
VRELAVEQVQIGSESTLIVWTMLLDEATLVFAAVYQSTLLFLAHQDTDISF